MVKRTIGSKGGTRGSSGLGYLQSSPYKAVFADLWAIVPNSDKPKEGAV
ncbi:hypothetical protein [uncultured Microbulbifer sp.]|nr:hypothetical protein [uncultured Microbulbifer sp.]